MPKKKAHNQTTEKQSRATGIDIGKKELVLAFHDTKKTHTFENSEQGRKRLVERLVNEQPSRIVCEATGGYERSLALELLVAKLPLDLVNPRRARDFAKSRGKLAKTDQIDAQVLALYAHSLGDAPRTVPDVDVLELQEVIARRQQLVEMRVQEKNRLQRATPKSKPSIQRMIEHLDQELKSIEDEADRMIRDNATWHERAKVLKAIDGIGDQTARILIAFFPELGALNRGEAGALAGLAPLNCDSGNMRGQRHIYGGRVRVRNALYLAALTATRESSPLHHFYKRLRAEKPAKVAIVAVARKLLTIANQVLKTGKPYDKKILFSA